MAAILTLAAAQTELRRRLAEPSAATYTNSELQEWLEYGARITSVLGQTYRTSNVATGQAITAGTGVYTISTITTLNPIKIWRAALAEITGDDNAYIGLQRVTMNQLGHNVDTAATRPIQYAVWNDSLYLFPLPDADTQTNYELWIWYTLVSPGTAADTAYGSSGDKITGVALTSDTWNHVIIDYALGSAYCKAGKHSKAAYHFSSFLQGIAFHRQDLTDDWDRPHSKDMRKIPDYTQTASAQEAQ